MFWGWNNGIKKFKSPSNNAAFTLVEVLIAFSIFTIVISLVLMSLLQSTRSFRQGQALSDKQRKERSCLFWLSRDLSSLVKLQQPEDNFSGQEGALYFVFARDEGLSESRYVCNLTQGELEHYSQSPADYNINTYQMQFVCLEGLAQCKFSYSNGTAWMPNWQDAGGNLPKMVKVIFQFRQDKSEQEFLINIPVAQ